MDRDSVAFDEAPIAPLHAHRNPISIAMLFYILTLAAIIAACLGRLSGDARVTYNSLGTAIAGGTFIGLLIGFLSGTFYFKSVKASLVGVGVGAILGTVAGALTIIRDADFVPMMTVTFSGCWLMIVIMLLAARWQVRR
jgi:hypothetical protein